MNRKSSCSVRDSYRTVTIGRRVCSAKFECIDRISKFCSPCTCIVTHAFYIDVGVLYTSKKIRDKIFEICVSLQPPSLSNIYHVIVPYLRSSHRDELGNTTKSVRSIFPVCSERIASVYYASNHATVIATVSSSNPCSYQCGFRKVAVEKYRSVESVFSNIPFFTESEWSVELLSTYFKSRVSESFGEPSLIYPPLSVYTACKSSPCSGYEVVFKTKCRKTGRAKFSSYTVCKISTHSDCRCSLSICTFFVEKIGFSSVNSSIIKFCISTKLYIFYICKSAHTKSYDRSKTQFCQFHSYSFFQVD